MEDLDRVRQAVGDVEVVYVESRDGLAVRTEREGAAPAPARIIPATSVQIASLGDRHPSEPVRADRKGAGDQDAATIRGILEKTVFDAIADTAVNPAAIGKKGRLGGAVGKDIVTGLISCRAI